MKRKPLPATLMYGDKLGHASNGSNINRLSRAKSQNPLVSIYVLDPH
jgi:hypothetical protein